MGGIAAFGTLLQMEDASTPGTYLTVAEIKDISGPSMSGNVMDGTTHTSPGGFREKIVGLLDAGEVTFDINWLPANPTHDNTTGFVALFRTRAVKSWRLAYPDTDDTVWEFDAYVSGFSPSAPVEGYLTASVTLTITGAPDFG